MFQIQNEPFLEWKGSNSNFKGRCILCLKTNNLIGKGCIYNIVGVSNVKYKTSPLELISIINEFPDIFPNDLLIIPLEREVDFSIDLLPWYLTYLDPSILYGLNKIKAVEVTIKIFCWERDLYGQAFHHGLPPYYLLERRTS